MECSIRYDPEQDCVFGSVKGEVASWSAIESFAAEVSKTLSSHSCNRLLNDLRQAPLKMWAIGLYNISDLIERTDIPQACKRALVVPSDDIEDYRFFEASAINRGFDIKVFQDMRSARCWLGLTS